MGILIFHAKTGGLANRLRALVGYRALARCLGIRFGLAWEVNDRCDTSFTALFEDGDIELIAPESLPALQPDSGVEIRDSASWFDAVWEACGRGRVGWDEYISQVRGCLEELNPVAEISAQVERFQETAAPWPTTGVHIRHTDNLQAYAGWAEKRKGVFKPSRISTLDGFLAALDRRASEGPFFLATDNADVELMLVRRYPDGVITLPKQYRNPGRRFQRPTSMQAALVELILLSRCPEIIGTYYSSFSKFAAIMTGADYYEIQDRRCARNRSVERMQLALGTKHAPVPLRRRLLAGQLPPL